MEPMFPGKSEANQLNLIFQVRRLSYLGFLTVAKGELAV